MEHLPPIVRGTTAIDVANAMLAERDEKGGPNTKDRSRPPMTMESIAAWNARDDVHGVQAEPGATTRSR